MARAGDSIDNPITRETITFRQTSHDTNGALLQIDLVAQPGGAPIAAHVHPKQEERFRIVNGRVRTWLAGRERELVTGDELVVPAGTPHYWKNIGDDACHVVVEFRPALQWEKLFATMFALARDGRTDQQGRPHPLQMAVTFNYFRDEAQPVEARDRILSRFLPILAPFGRLLGYTAIYPNPTRDQRR
jgi:quercetin dioxygenase-like cupin family protein